jgi:hypothetical protein
MSANKKMNSVLNTTNRKVRFQDYLYLGKITVLGAVLLTGCAATQIDMLQKRGALPETEYRIAKEMADMALQYCRKSHGFTNLPYAKERIMATHVEEPWMIKRFYTSPNSDWYKADGIATGMVADLYYNPNTKQFTCGSGWKAFANSASVRFVEWGKSESRLSGVRE